MANFDIYNEVGVKVAENQPSPVKVEGLKPNTTYAGWKIAYAGSDVKTDVPTFKTAPRLLSSFRINNTDISGNVGENATVKAAYFKPADATDKSLTATVEDDTVATITDNKDNTYTVNFLKVGTTKVQWAANDGGGAKVDANVIVAE